jgi:hypothetical protein
MGRKGVSKRKPVQTKSKPLTSEAASGSVSSALRAPESLPAKSASKSAEDHKKTPKKG